MQFTRSALCVRRECAKVRNMFMVPSRLSEPNQVLTGLDGANKRKKEKFHEKANFSISKFVGALQFRRNSSCASAGAPFGQHSICICGWRDNPSRRLVSRPENGWKRCGAVDSLHRAKSVNHGCDEFYGRREAARTIEAGLPPVWQPLFPFAGVERRIPQRERTSDRPTRKGNRAVCQAGKA